jgi:hypothetical protein
MNHILIILLDSINITVIYNAPFAALVVQELEALLVEEKPGPCAQMQNGLENKQCGKK